MDGRYKKVRINESGIDNVRVREIKQNLTGDLNATFDKKMLREVASHTQFTVQEIMREVYNRISKRSDYKKYDIFELNFTRLKTV